ncbi:MAG: DUF4278 domain-containing protein [Cyanobacteria bacterium Co-bin13]|nr:DUF4278 domain-containing protein [Cyanobacteria bacterium Co-bin13]
MSLRYRGVSYEPTQPQVEISEELIGRYRGAAVSRHTPKQAAAHTPAQGLKYRGAAVK